jgi:nanoRNase/pAp phosphatase (c-di-AMP/oligoRNAs hydrolase)
METASLWLSEFGRFLLLSRGPAAAAIAQSNANAQNAEMISATIERGQANMAMLERAVIKDISCRVNGMAASFTLRHWFLRMGRSPTP